MITAFKKFHSDGTNRLLNTAKTTVFSMVTGGISIVIGLTVPLSAQAQTGSFAFGQGGFVDTGNGSQGVFNECAGIVHGYGTSDCTGQTYIKGNFGSTLTLGNSSSGTGTYGLPSNNAIGAAATFNRYGNGASATACSLSQNAGATNCASGAYASLAGAFAKTSFGSTGN